MTEIVLIYSMSLYFCIQIICPMLQVKIMTRKTFIFLYWWTV